MMIRLWRPLRHLAVLVLAIAALVSSDLSGQGRRGRASVMINGHEAVDGEVLVRFRPAAAAFEQARAADEVEADEVEPIGRRGTRRMRARRLGTRELMTRLRANPDVEFVEPNYVIRLLATPNDPSFGNLWGLFNFGQSFGGTGIAGADIDATLAWDLTTGSRASVVGVVDSGIDYNHPDLAANIWSAPAPFSVTIGGVVINCAAGTHGFNAINNTCNPMDDNSHGTHVAGTIGAVGNNGLGVAGVNWTASMMGLKFLSASGSGNTSNAIKAIEFAVQAKAVFGGAANVRVLSNSWGGGGYSQALLDEINRANTHDMLFVAAAGNDGLNADFSPMYPAAYSAPNIISVAATDNRDRRASFSNYGAASVNLGAPGVAILSTTPNNSYASYNGTSMAAPQVAGAAALVLSECSMTTAALRTALLNTVDPIPALAGITTTGGRLNVNAAVRTCTPPSLSVNGQAGPVTVAGGSMITVGVSNGPGFRADWLMMVPAGSPPQTWGTYLYLNGTRTAPASAMISASVQFVAPAAGGTFEFRLYENDAFNLRATSSAVTVTAANPVPAVTSLSPARVTAGAPGFTLTVHGNGFVPASQILVNGSARATTYLSAAILTTAIGAGELSSARTLAISVSSPSPGGGTSGAMNFMVNPPAAAPALSINGGSGAVTAAGGSTVTVGVTNGPGSISDWLMMVPAGAPAQTWGTYVYLSGTRTRPAAGMTSAALPFVAPLAGGTFEFRFYQNDSWTLLATSAVLTVTPASSSSPTLRINGALGQVTVAGGSAITVAVANGPGYLSDWVMMVPAGSPAETWGTYVYLSGTRTRPAAGMTSASLQFAAPAGGGQYEFRFYQNDSFTLLATSAVVTVTSGIPTVTVNGGTGPVTVPGGSQIAVAVRNGPGNISDWVMMVPAGAPAETWGDYKYLSGSRTRPISGLTAATIAFSTPAGGGAFEFRFYRNDSWALLAASSAVTVTP